MSLAVALLNSSRSSQGLPTVRLDGLEAPAWFQQPGSAAPQTPATPVTSTPMRSAVASKVRALQAASRMRSQSPLRVDTRGRALVKQKVLAKGSHRPSMVDSPAVR